MSRGSGAGLTDAARAAIDTYTRAASEHARARMVTTDPAERRRHFRAMKRLYRARRQEFFDEAPVES